MCCESRWKSYENLFFFEKKKEMNASHTITFYKEIKQTEILSIRKIFILVVMPCLWFSFWNTPKTKSKVDDCFVWTEKELQLLETITDFKAEKTYEGVDLECVKDKYAPILNISVSNLFQKSSREYFERNEEIFLERSDCSQNQTASFQI